MAKSNFHGGGPFDPPSGQVTFETPDGVIKTYDGGEARLNLLAADYVRGGFDGCAYGAFREPNEGLAMYERPLPPNRIKPY